MLSGSIAYDSSVLKVCIEGEMVQCTHYDGTGLKSYNQNARARRGTIIRGLADTTGWQAQGAI